MPNPPSRTQYILLWTRSKARLLAKSPFARGGRICSTLRPSTFARDTSAGAWYVSAQYILPVRMLGLGVGEGLGPGIGAVGPAVVGVPVDVLLGVPVEVLVGVALLVAVGTMVGVWASVGALEISPPITCRPKKQAAQLSFASAILSPFTSN